MSNAGAHIASAKAHPGNASAEGRGFAELKVPLFRVLYVCPGFPDARGIKWVATFGQMGAEVLVVRGRGRPLSPWEVGGGFRVETVERLENKNPFHPAVAMELVKRVRLFDPDFVFARDIFVAGHALRVANALRIPCYVDVADNYPEVVASLPLPRPLKSSLSCLLNAWESYVLRNAAGLIFVSAESMRHVLSKHRLHKDAAFVVENVPQGWTPRPMINRTFGGRLVYIGTLDQGIRDVQTVVRGLRLYREMFNEHVSLMIYSFEPSEAKRLVSASGGDAGTPIEIAPVVHHEDLMSVLAAFDVGIVPHNRCPGTEYTIPNKLFDYLYGGIRVLSSDNPPLRRVLAEIGGGTTYRCGDPHDFARALRRLKNDIERGGNVADPDVLTTRFRWAVQVKPVTDAIMASITTARESKGV